MINLVKKPKAWNLGYGAMLELGLKKRQVFHVNKKEENQRHLKEVYKRCKSPESSRKLKWAGNQ